mgnify:CR=1 FL=1
MNEISEFIKKAEENIKVSELLAEQKIYSIAISRLYYAMFYIAEALLLTKGLVYSSHYAVIANFGKEFAKTGIFDAKFHNGLQKVFDLRQEADYEPFAEFTKEEVENYLSLAKEFLEKVKEYLREIS